MQDFWGLEKDAALVAPVEPEPEPEPVEEDLEVDENGDELEGPE